VRAYVVALFWAGVFCGACAFVEWAGAVINR
jgi:hypothetical protein